jgi:hypothetical protein
MNCRPGSFLSPRILKPRRRPPRHRRNADSGADWPPKPHAVQITQPFGSCKKYHRLCGQARTGIEGFAQDLYLAPIAPAGRDKRAAAARHLRSQAVEKLRRDSVGDLIKGSNKICDRKGGGRLRNVSYNSYPLKRRGQCAQIPIRNPLVPGTRI